jgi:hypothetical protein
LLLPAFFAGVPAGGGGNRNPGGNKNPNSMITGTAPFALAGVVNVRSMLTVIARYDELSTCPINFFVMAGT